MLYVYVPAKYTDELQPLDATVNKKYKQYMCDEFQNWFATEVAVSVEEGKVTDDIAKDVGLRTATIKHVKNGRCGGACLYISDN